MGASPVLTFLLHFKNTLLIFRAVNSFPSPLLSPQPLCAFTFSIYPFSDLELRVGAAHRPIPEVQPFPAQSFAANTEFQEIHWHCSKHPQKALTKFTALHPLCIRQLDLHRGCSEHKRNQLFLPWKDQLSWFHRDFSSHQCQCLAAPLRSVQVRTWWKCSQSERLSADCKEPWFNIFRSFPNLLLPCLYSRPCSCSVQGCEHGIHFSQAAGSPPGWGYRKSVGVGVQGKMNK